MSKLGQSLPLNYHFSFLQHPKGCVNNSLKDYSYYTGTSDALEHLLQWLERSDFFSSAVNHGKYTGTLLNFPSTTSISLQVVTRLPLKFFFFRRTLPAHRTRPLPAHKFNQRDLSIFPPVRSPERGANPGRPRTTNLHALSLINSAGVRVLGN